MYVCIYIYTHRERERGREREIEREWGGRPAPPCPPGAHPGVGGRGAGQDLIQEPMVH